MDEPIATLARMHSPSGSGDDTETLAALRVALWQAHDAAFGAEMAAGQLRGQVKQLEAELDDRRRHAEALLIEVEVLRQRIHDLDAVSAHRDAMLASPTWRLGEMLLKPAQRVRRVVRRT